MFIHKNHNFGVNFLAPDGLTANAEIMFPFNDKQSKAYNAAIEITVKQVNTLVEVATLTGDTTITVVNGTVEPLLPQGASLVLKLAANGSNRTVTLSDGTSTGTITVVANTTVYVYFYFDGTNFCLLSNLTLVLGASSEIQTPAYAAGIEITVTKQNTIVNAETLTGALALTVVVDAAVLPGAKLMVKLGSDTTARDTTPGAGFTSPVIAGVISKIKYAHFIYDGTNFIYVASPQVN